MSKQGEEKGKETIADLVHLLAELHIKKKEINEQAQRIEDQEEEALRRLLIVTSDNYRPAKIECSTCKKFFTTNWKQAFLTSDAFKEGDEVEIINCICLFLGQSISEGDCSGTILYTLRNSVYL